MYSKRVAKGLLDGRSANGRFVRHTKAELLRELGREPTFKEKLLIEQTSIIALQLSLAAEKIDAGAVEGPHDNHQMVAWFNCFRRNLVELGLGEPTASKPASYVPDPYEFSRMLDAQRARENAS